mmetsp:Transcript_1377/g.4017  ORF Transcript_1377/g.4017 Transcript_1377/m.4017 type:complete len:217 (-) Transcript_1377:130-780(-)
MRLLIACDLSLKSRGLRTVVHRGPVGQRRRLTPALDAQTGRIHAKTALAAPTGGRTDSSKTVAAGRRPRDVPRDPRAALAAASAAPQDARATAHSAANAEVWPQRFRATGEGLALLRGTVRLPSFTVRQQARLRLPRGAGRRPCCSPRPFCPDSITHPCLVATMRATMDPLLHVDLRISRGLLRDASDMFLRHLRYAVKTCRTWGTPSHHLSGAPR